MPSIRRLPSLVVSMLLSVNMICCAAPACADPADDAYLTQLRAQGLTWPADHNDYMVKLGLHICLNRLRGWPPDQLAEEVHSVLGHDGLTLDHVSEIVNTAEATYCPS